MTFAEQADALRYKAERCDLLLRKRPKKETWMLYWASMKGHNRKASIQGGGYVELLAYLDGVLFGKGKGRLPFNVP